jgi:hypothetical protein
VIFFLSLAASLTVQFGSHFFVLEGGSRCYVAGCSLAELIIAARSLLLLRSALSIAVGLTLVLSVLPSSKQSATLHSTRSAHFKQ